MIDAGGSTSSAACTNCESVTWLSCTKGSTRYVLLPYGTRWRGSAKKSRSSPSRSTTFSKLSNSLTNWLEVKTAGDDDCDILYIKIINYTTIIKCTTIEFPTQLRLKIGYLKRWQEDVTRKDWRKVVEHRQRASKRDVHSFAIAKPNDADCASQPVFMS